MAILKIARMGHEVLYKLAEEIADPTVDDVAKLASDMIDTLRDIGANGLAAPQVHVSKRLIVYRIAEHQIPCGSDMKPVDWRVLINPVITPLSDDQMPIWERCLSIPGMHGKVPRYTRITLEAVGLDGLPIRIDATGFHAMLLQHEYDHLDGILYPMRMGDLSTLSFDTELGDRGFFVPRDVSEFVD